MPVTSVAEKDAPTKITGRGSSANVDFVDAMNEINRIGNVAFGADVSKRTAIVVTLTPGAWVDKENKPIPQASGLLAGTIRRRLEVAGANHVIVYANSPTQVTIRRRMPSDPIPKKRLAK